MAFDRLQGRPTRGGRLTQGQKPTAELSQDLKESREEWGKLHPRDRKAIEEAAGEKVLEKYKTRHQRNVKAIAPAAYHVLIRHRWPGNVRELENVIERGVLVSKGTEITVNDLPESLRTETTTTTEFVIPPHRTLAEIEKMAIMQTLQRTNWNKQEAAQILGLYRPTLYSKMKKHEIQDGGKSGARRAAGA